MLVTRNAPVPYVAFVPPESNAACPTSAACWSPRIVASVVPSSTPEHGPISPIDGTISGSTDIGTPTALQSSSSHSSVSMFMSIVRLALVTSVMWRPVSFHAIHESIVPKARSPESASLTRPGSRSSSQRIFGPAKYVAGGSPVRSRNQSTPRSSESLFARSAVRMSCHTIAFATGWPDRLLQRTVVSRWFVMPIPERSPGSSPALSRASAMTVCVFVQIWFASCSTHPGCGRIWSCSICDTATKEPSSSTTTNLVLVVPWSIAPTYFAMPAPSVVQFSS